MNNKHHNSSIGSPSRGRQIERRRETDRAGERPRQREHAPINQRRSVDDRAASRSRSPLLRAEDVQDGTPRDQQFHQWYRGPNRSPYRIPRLSERASPKERPPRPSAPLRPATPPRPPTPRVEHRRPSRADQSGRIEGLERSNIRLRSQVSVAVENLTDERIAELIAQSWEEKVAEAKLRQQKLQEEADQLREQLNRVQREQAFVHSETLAARPRPPPPESTIAEDPYENPVASGSGLPPPVSIRAVPDSPVLINDSDDQGEPEFSQLAVIERLYEFDEGDPEGESADNILLASVDEITDPLELPEEIPLLIEAERMVINIRHAIQASGFTSRLNDQLLSARATAAISRRAFAERHARLDRGRELAQRQREQAEQEEFRSGRRSVIERPKTGEHPNFNQLVHGLQHDRSIPINELTPRRRHQLALRLNQVVHNLRIQRDHRQRHQVSLQSALELYQSALGTREFASDRSGHEGASYWLQQVTSVRRDIRQGLARIRRIDSIIEDATSRLEELQRYNYSAWSLRNAYKHIGHMSLTRARHVFAQESVRRDFPQGLPLAGVRQEIIRRRERAFYLYETWDPLIITNEYMRSYLEVRASDHDIDAIHHQLCQHLNRAAAEK